MYLRELKNTTQFLQQGVDTPKILMLQNWEKWSPIPEALLLVPSSMHNDTVISQFVICTSLSYYNGSQRTQNK
jgi:hypothetical protein